MKPGTVANERSVLRHRLRLAHEWGYLDAVPRVKLPKRSTGRLRYLEVEEGVRLLEACRASRNPYLWTIVTLAINTGMRRGEILGLEWERVDLSSARITLYHTKNSKPRGVPINRGAYGAPVALQPDSAKRSGRLFRLRGGGLDEIQNAFTAAVHRAKIADFHFHDLRHTFASHAIMNGVSVAELREILGHSTLTMTMRYAHLAPTHLLGAVGKIDGLFSGKVADGGPVLPSLVPAASTLDSDTSK